MAHTHHHPRGRVLGWTTPLRGHLRRLTFHTFEPPNPTYPQAQSMTPSALATARAQRRGASDVRRLRASGALALGALERALANTGASHPQRRCEGRLCDPALGDAVRTCVEKAKARQEWPARQNTLADWPRLAKAGGHPEPDPTLAGRIKAGGASIGRRLWAAVFHVARPPCFCSDSLWRSGRL